MRKTISIESVLAELDFSELVCLSEHWLTNDKIAAIKLISYILINKYSGTMLKAGAVVILPSLILCLAVGLIMLNHSNIISNTHTQELH